MTALMLAFFFVFFPACGGAEARKTSEDEPPIVIAQAPGVRVEVARVQTSKASLELSLPGEIEGAKDALLASARGGYIERVRVSEGQSVKRGDRLIDVNTRVYAAQLVQAEAQRDLAQAELARLEAVADLSSQAQYDAMQTQVKVAEAAAEIAQIEASRSVIRASFDGVVSQLNATVGEIASPGAPLVRVVQLDPAHVLVSASDRDVVALRTGMKAAVSTEALPAVYDGKVIHIDPAADPRTRAFGVKLEVANPERKLLPGMIANVVLSETLSEGTVVIPQDWLVTRLDEVGVYLDVDGVAAWRTVTPGAVVYDQVVIEKGLSVGDRLVVTGQRGLAEGDPLILAREGVCCRDGRAVY